MDRDGTVCREVNYLSRPEDLRIFPFAGEAIRRLNENDFLVILVTNQSGVGRGYFDVQTLQKIHEKLIRELASDGARLDGIYFCPHTPGDNCPCRKPKPGMIDRAGADFVFDPGQSWMVGDKAVDVETGYNSGCRTALVLTGYGREEVEKLVRQPDLIAADLTGVVGHIIKPNSKI